MANPAETNIPSIWDIAEPDDSEVARLKFPDRVSFKTVPEVLYTKTALRVLHALALNITPTNPALISLFLRLKQAGGARAVNFAISTSHDSAMSLHTYERMLRNEMLEMLRCWYTEELHNEIGHVPMRLHIQKTKMGAWYRLTSLNY